MTTGYCDYKTIRNFIRQYKREALLWQLISVTCKVSRSGVDLWQKGYAPWEMLLLAKWIVVDWDAIKGTKPVDTNVINTLINKVKSFVDMPDPLLTQGEQGITKFMRRMAFQQFWYQKNLSASSAGRAIKLLIEPTFSAALESKLTSQIGLSRREIVEIALMIWSGFLAQDNILYLKHGFFSAVSETLSEEKVRLFFKLFSVHIDFLYEYASSVPSPKNYFNEVYERPPFLKKPFIENRNGDIHLWSVPILHEIIEHGVYDLLKTLDSGKFGDDFGPIFEKYLASQISHQNLAYVDENSQKRQGYTQQVDFIIEDDDEVILIEAKGIEASPLTQVVPFDEIMSNAYKKNIVKALSQAHGVYSRLIKDGKTKVPYLLVVSYKELYLGNGENVWDEFIETTLRDEYGITDFAIPVENIFFASIDGFDKLLVCTDGKVANLASILREIVAKKKDIKDKRFVFTQYLEDMDGLNLKERTQNNLNEKFEEFHTNLLNKYFPGWKGPPAE